MGAFLAGISLASSDYREIISGKMTTLRDFLLLFFFINLGAGLDLSLIGEQFKPAVIFSLFVLIGNPIIVLVIMGLMGYRKRTSFLAGLAVAQISEFSLILASLGLQLGRYGNNIAKSLERNGKKIMGVDFDPGAVKKWKKKGRIVQLGDAEDPDLPERSFFIRPASMGGKILRVLVFRYKS